MSEAESGASLAAQSRISLPLNPGYARCRRARSLAVVELAESYCVETRVRLPETSVVLPLI